MAFIHQGEEQDAEKHIAAYQLQDVLRISDPERMLYAAFELGKIPGYRFLNPMLWLRGFVLAILKKHGSGPTDGDKFQKPGVFLIRSGRISRSHVYQEVWDHPDFVKMASDLES